MSRSLSSQEKSNVLKLYRRTKGQDDLEVCYSILATRPLTPRQLDQLRWLIGDPLSVVTSESAFRGAAVVEIGPRVTTETPDSSNAVAICRSIGLPIERIEYSTRYKVSLTQSREALESLLNPMTQAIYEMPLETFDTGLTPQPVTLIPVLDQGEGALREFNARLGLGMDDWDIAYYTRLFQRLERDPTDVELFQIGNGMSEHSRHWFFRGRLKIDGQSVPHSLMDVVRMPLWANKRNSLVAFKDNAGVIVGGEVATLLPQTPGQPSPLVIARVVQHPSATAETHNHPTRVEPFEGAATGAGGRIRDNYAVGRGAHVSAGLAGYIVGNLHLPRHAIPGEVVGGESHAPYASPVDVLIRGSNGVSDFADKIGEPLVGGVFRSFGLNVGGRRRESIKPTLYTAGLGRISDQNVEKRPAEPGMLILRIGGPAYRIGVGGAGASSMTTGTQGIELDLKSVQRGDPEMENRVNRVIRACAEMREHNPIESIHDQGAGGPSNVITELMEPAGGRVDIRQIVLGDQTLSVLEIWVAEYQEGYGLLVRPENLTAFQAICARERVNCEVLGEITGDGFVVVVDSADGSTPVNLPMADFLSEMPRKEFTLERLPITHPPLELPDDLTIEAALMQTVRLPQVGANGFLVNKIDRSVTGLVAQQPCVGPMQVPVADVGITADGYFGLTGAATALGERPNIMLVDPAAGARIAVAEMLTNLASVRISNLADVRCRANWMWAAKQPGEGALLYDAAIAVSEFMLTLGIAIDGGKDSLSMATPSAGELVVSPGELIVMGYAPVPDITKKVTPDLKGGGILGLIDLGWGKNRLGGSSLAQAHGQLGDEVPDVDALDLSQAFMAVQELIARGLLTAYHDRSDGGLITTVTEMCLAGNVGAELICEPSADLLAELFTEEAGMVLEFGEESRRKVEMVLADFGVPYREIGRSGGRGLTIYSGPRTEFAAALVTLRQWWEATSLELELYQSNPETVVAERQSLTIGRPVTYQLSFVPAPTPPTILLTESKPKVAILREEGTNGDREMAAAFAMAGFEPWDLTMSDLLAGRITSLDSFRGMAAPGGFAYADIFGSAKGWAAPIRFNPRIRELFEGFFARPDTFSLGVCNGNQLMAHTGQVPYVGIPEKSRPALLHNFSGRFESRWVAVRVEKSPSILFQGMEGSILGINVAHGEGRLFFPDPAIIDEIKRQQLVPLVYVDPDGEPTEAYPFNPNGSPFGWTALCTPDGRHTAMMPHAERSFQLWQWPWLPEDFRGLKASPWLKLFQNAYDWCRQS